MSGEEVDLTVFVRESIFHFRPVESDEAKRAASVLDIVNINVALHAHIHILTSKTSKPSPPNSPPPH